MSRGKILHLELLFFQFCLLILSGIIIGFENGPDVLKVVVKEDGDAVLPCSLGTEENIVQELFDWKKDGLKEVFLYEAGIHYNNGRTGQDEQFKGRVSHFKDELKRGNASIIIRAAKMSDSGNYTCAFPRRQPPRQRVLVMLVVEPTLKDRSHENTGAAAKPFITVADATELGVQLDCNIQGGFPQPELMWLDADQRLLAVEQSQISKREGRYDVTLQINVTASSRFRCVAIQVEIGHMAEAEIAVSEKLFGHRDTCSNGLVIGCIVAAVGVLISFSVFLLLRAPACFRKLHYKKSVQREECDLDPCEHTDVDWTEKRPPLEIKNMAKMQSLRLE